MAITRNLSERAKYTYLLQLSQEQIRAIERNDMHAFDQILLAKGSIIESLADPAELIKADPSLETIIERLKASEIEAQEKLNVLLNEIKTKLNTAQSYKQARHAYRRFTPIGTSGYDFRLDKTIPRFIDRAL
ncbi:MAG: hypothetical protein P4L33_02975 [Capsulimonadaceae bacterium]|nr:hypothetical protein [Capsulimonadaceae bacterium]